MRKIVHVRARRNQWVRVHRQSGAMSGFSGTGDGVGPVWSVIGFVIAASVAVAIIEALWPLLLVGAIGWIALKIFGSSR